MAVAAPEDVPMSAVLTEVSLDVVVTAAALPPDASVEPWKNSPCGTKVSAVVVWFEAAVVAASAAPSSVVTSVNAL